MSILLTTMLCKERQVGSTFKPFVYAVVAVDEGYSPCYEVPTCLLSLKGQFGLLKDWAPQNSDGEYGWNG